MRKDYSSGLILLFGLAAGTLLTGISAPQVAGGAAPPQSAPESQDARTAWYRQAKFGMFIHWGPYSLAGVEASWPIMRPEAQWSITEPEYVSLYKRFNPTHYDPAA